MIKDRNRVLGRRKVMSADDYADRSLVYNALSALARECVNCGSKLKICDGMLDELYDGMLYGTIAEMKRHNTWHRDNIDELREILDMGKHFARKIKSLKEEDFESKLNALEEVLNEIQ